MGMFSSLPEIPVQQITDPILEASGISLFLKRLDLTHPKISGNKWYKLKYNLLEAKKQNKNTLLTFGGAFSNHIVAVAAAGKELGFKTIGIIRGERTLPLNKVLSFAEECGMQLEYISREDYRKKEDQKFIDEFFLLPSGEAGRGVYLIPEGGSNLLAVKGCVEILNEEDRQYNYICCACGTGATLAGIILSLKADQRAIGFSILKGENTLSEKVKDWINDSNTTKNNWEINTQYHFGGYAKHAPELLNFIDTFRSQHNIQLDPVYTGKMMAGIYDLISKKYFPKGSKILAIHTGGVLTPSNYK